MGQGMAFGLCLVFYCKAAETKERYLYIGSRFHTQNEATGTLSLDGNTSMPI